MGFSFVAVAYVAAALVLGLVALHLRRSTAPRGLRVVARLPLEPRRSLHVVELAGRVLVLASSEAGLSLVTELDPASVAELEATPAAPLGAFLPLGRRA